MENMPDWIMDWMLLSVVYVFFDVLIAAGNAVFFDVHRSSDPSSSRCSHYTSSHNVHGLTLDLCKPLAATSESTYELPSLES